MTSTPRPTCPATIAFWSFECDLFEGHTGDHNWVDSQADYPTTTDKD